MQSVYKSNQSVTAGIILICCWSLAGCVNDNRLSTEEQRCTYNTKHFSDLNSASKAVHDTIELTGDNPSNEVFEKIRAQSGIVKAQKALVLNCMSDFEFYKHKKIWLALNSAVSMLDFMINVSDSADLSPKRKAELISQASPVLTDSLNSIDPGVFCEDGPCG